MTDMEKKVMLRLCAKVMQYADLSEDLEAENLVNWVLLDYERKQKNNEIRELMGEYKRSEPERRESIKEALAQGNRLCEQRGKLYQEQQEIKHKLWQAEKGI